MTEPKPRSGFKRWTIRILSGFLVLVAVIMLAGYVAFRQSLPQLEGRLITDGIGDAVTVSRDEYGVPTVRAATRSDASYVLGYLHAQERFFQMDLLRRAGAGELSELLGDATLKVDRVRRRHRFRHRSDQALLAFPDRDIAILDAYTNGINAGLTALGRFPFEYSLLRVEPEPWTNADTLLAVYAMYFDLQDEDNHYERDYSLLHDIMGKEFGEFIAPLSTSWDAPIDGGVLPLPPIPDGSSLPGQEQSPTASLKPPFDQVVPGSNNWVVGGALTETGAAIVANDMHLGLGVPNIWYRVRLIIEDADTDVTGVTLPGVPAIVVGSNGHIAWGFTNSQTDTQDIVYLDWVDEQAGVYATPDGPQSIETITENICSSAGNCTDLTIRETIWGPLLEAKNHSGRSMVTSWIAHHPDAVNMYQLNMENAKNVEDAVKVAHKAGQPAQNLVIGDKHGNIAYTLLGPLPARFGHSGLLPTSWSDGSNGWRGRLLAADTPLIINPPGDRLWSANARMVSGEMLANVGFGNYALAARQHQIRDRLMALESINENDMLAIQLDDEALFLTRWQLLLLDYLSGKSGDRITTVRDAVENWGGRAVPESVAYRVIRRFRSHVTMRIITGLTQPLSDFLGSRFPWYSRTAEGPTWRLISERPKQLIPVGYQSWDEIMDASMDDVLLEITDAGGLDKFTWGAYAKIDIDHPLANAVPGLGWLTDTQQQQPAGDFGNLPRVNAGSWGASERMVVSPGHEENGYFHMPSGQSGHPLSPYFNKGHEDWVNGARSPFLPGDTKWTLTFEPR